MTRERLLKALQGMMALQESLLWLKAARLALEQRQQAAVLAARALLPHAAVTVARNCWSNVLVLLLLLLRAWVQEEEQRSAQALGWMLLP